MQENSLTKWEERLKQQNLFIRTNPVTREAKSLCIKVYKFDRGEIHKTIADEYDSQRKELLRKLNVMEKKADSVHKGAIARIKQQLWRLLPSLKYRTSAI